MTSSVDLYDSHYGRVGEEIYRRVREQTYGRDLGQTSWMTAAECDEFCSWLQLRPGAHILEIASGSGGTARYMAEQHETHVTGIDINEAAVAAAREAASESTTFQVVDANAGLPFGDGQFDAAFCNDSFNHLKERQSALKEVNRVLKTGGRYFYTDPTVITGCISDEEIAMRSAIGFYTYTAPGINERMIEAAGFRVVLRSDVTHSVAGTAGRWLEARKSHEAALVELEGEQKFSELQQFLSMVRTLALQRRLSRYGFVCEKT